MPFFRSGGDIIYFAHIPKCAGIAINSYLIQHFGPLAFLDRKFMHQPELERWTKSSPQHVPARVLDRYFPKDFFDKVFTVVRHPVDRLVERP